MRETRTRDSRIELLRIISSLMILSHHAIQHGGEGIYSFIHTHPSLNQLYSVAIGSWGQLGVSVFIIITAWYSVDKMGGYSLEK